MQLTQDIWKAVVKSKELIEAGSIGHASDLIADAVEGAAGRSETSARFPNLIITGPPRSGKSLLADRIKALTTGAIINCDTLLRAYGGLPEAEKRLEAMNAVYSAIFSRIGYGLIVVGDEFVTRDCVTGSGIEFLNNCRNRFGVQAVVIGCDLDSVEQKFHCIEEWRGRNSCWTTRNPRFSSEEARKRLANYIISRSKFMGKVCKENNVEYRSIRSSSFIEDIDRISRDVVSSLRAA